MLMHIQTKWEPIHKDSQWSKTPQGGFTVMNFLLTLAVEAGHNRRDQTWLHPGEEENAIYMVRCRQAQLRAVHINKV